MVLELLFRQYIKSPEKTYFELFSVQLKKALELNEQLRQRMGVVIVGPSGAGKSTLWRMLRAALSKMGKVVSGISHHFLFKALARNGLIAQESSFPVVF